ncbi:MAG TPA: CPBP family intramembrane glutamic endopeptidase [Acidimicrobiia bacterium]|nr:CPBP family intramembrane glutamic endopeptidase [Acidimicrobiia bacterium]
MAGEPDAFEPPRAAGPRIRWGLPDVAVAWIVGVVAAVIAGSIVGAATGVKAGRVGDDVGVLLASVVGQAIGVIGTLALVSARKGRGSLSDDFGLVPRLPGRSWTTATLWVLGGIALQVVSLPFLQLLVDVHGKVETQDVVEQFEHARGPTLILFAVLVVTVAPVAEELLFRGALLRGLQRRMSPAWAALLSALAFAAVHPLSSPTIGSVIAVPALFALGLVSAAAAIRTGDLSRSILLHAGFNLLTAVTVVVSR